MSQAIIEAKAKALFEYCQMDGKSLICAYARDDLDPKDADILIVGDKGPGGKGRSPRRNKNGYLEEI